MAFTIRTQGDYEKAMLRIQELRTRSPASVAEESELRHLLSVADEWDRTTGGEAAGERSIADALARETGAGFALWMAKLFPERDWVAELASLVDQKRSYVERHFPISSKLRSGSRMLNLLQEWNKQVRPSVG
ncbi:hypothetical protein [Bosea rubneri]|uniref:Uncharacterized protein n=1 Tax=Bosea rubneri TaxID=3075434 RepID=A0ABU3SG04_9HYPH|nr:hypothetical protein [Bosea sp. ZW T0_25]MDU0343730.1 hypothetical protein [Bosea sp. ZW T0_25]